MYEYKAIIVNIVDGDTVDVDIDLGFDTWLKNKRIRINNIDAPETRTRDLFEKEQGLAAKERARELLPLNSKQTLLSKDWQEKYGRIIGDFKLKQGLFSEIMLQEGHALVYRD